MTQELLPISSQDVVWALNGGATAEDCVDDTIAGQDLNATFLNGLSVSNHATLIHRNGIPTGGDYTGWAVKMVSRRVGAQAFPDREPRILVEWLSGGSVIKSESVLHTGGAVFTTYTMTLTPSEAMTVDILDVKVRLTLTQLFSGNSCRVTALSVFLPDPSIILIPARVRLTFPSWSIVQGGRSTDRGAIVSAGADDGCLVAAGAEAGWVNECP